MFESFKSMDMKLHFLLEEAILAIVVQGIGMFLILSAVVMFIKHISLHKLENAFQINLLLSSAVFLVIDWTLTLPGHLGCEVFSLVFIVFGTVCTYTTAGIALNRFKRMMRMSFNISAKISTVLSISTIWLISLLCILYPAILRATSDVPRKEEMNELSNSSEEINFETMCFFDDGVLYRSTIPSLCFALVGIIFPVFTMLFAYIKIYKKVRKARIDRWLNQVAMERSQQTAVIRMHGRKANVFQLSNRSSRTNLRTSRPSDRAFGRERSVLTKGLFAVIIVVFCWVPFSTTWLYLSLSFHENYMIYFRYLMIIAKVSVILNVAHYVCFNTKYRSLYLQTAFAPFTNFLRLLQSDAADDNSSHLDSQIVSYTTSNVQERPIFTLQTNTALTPIHENLTRDNDTIKALPLRKKTSKKRSYSIFNHQHKLQRSASVPEKLRKTAKAVHPYPL